MASTDGPQTFALVRRCPSALSRSQTPTSHDRPRAGPLSVSASMVSSARSASGGSSSEGNGCIPGLSGGGPETRPGPNRRSGFVDGQETTCQRRPRTTPLRGQWSAVGRTRTDQKGGSRSPRPSLCGPPVPGLLPERFRVGDVVAPCFEGLPRNAPIGVVAAGVQDAVRVHGEVGRRVIRSAKMPAYAARP